MAEKGKKKVSLFSKRMTEIICLNAMYNIYEIA